MGLNGGGRKSPDACSFPAAPPGCGSQAGKKDAPRVRRSPNRGCGWGRTETAVCWARADSGRCEGCWLPGQDECCRQAGQEGLYARNCVSLHSRAPALIPLKLLVRPEPSTPRARGAELAQQADQRGAGVARDDGTNRKTKYSEMLSVTVSSGFRTVSCASATSAQQGQRTEADSPAASRCGAVSTGALASTTHVS